MNYYLVLLFAVSLFSLNSCKERPNDISHNQQQHTIPIGGLFSITGSWNTLGIDAIAAANLAVNHANSIAEERGLSVRFSFTSYDTKLDPSVALSALEQAHSSNIHVIVGPQSSSEVSAIKAYADSNSILIISPSSTSGTLAIPNDYILRMCPIDVLEGPAIASMMKAEGKTVMIPFWRNDLGNKGLESSTRAAFTKLGGTVLTGISYEANTNSFATSLNTLRQIIQDAKKQYSQSEIAIYNPAFDEAALMAQEIPSNDSLLRSITWYGGDGTVNSSALLSQSTFFEQVRYACPSFGIGDATVKAQSIINAIQSTTGHIPDAYALSVYDAVMITALTYMSSDDDINPTLLKNAIQQQAELYYGATGWTQLDTNGDRKYGAFDLLGIKTINNGASWQVLGTYSELTGYKAR